MKWVSVGILVVGILAAIVLATRTTDLPKTPRGEPVTLVKITTVNPVDQVVTITAYGTVQEEQMLRVLPEVSGRIIEQSPNLVTGGRFKKDEVLLRIDPRNYQSVVEQEQAAVARAEYELKLERGRKAVAEREWQLLQPNATSTELGRELALREPQIEDKEASLLAAQSRFKKAQLDVQRTEIRAPFNAQVISEGVEIGQVVNPQTPIVTLVGTDDFRVQVSVPIARLPWIALPTESGGRGAQAWILQEQTGTVLRREGWVNRLLADVDTEGRMARLQIAVKDPMSGAQPLLLGSYVRAEIMGPKLEGVYVLPRGALKEGNTLWIMDDKDRLVMRTVDVVHGDAETIIVAQGLQPNERVIVSEIPLPIPGMLLGVGQ